MSVRSRSWAAVDPVRWPGLLADLCDAFASQGVMIFTRHKVTNEICFRIDHGISPESWAEYEAQVAANDLRTPFGLEEPQIRVFPDHRFPTDAEMDPSPCYDGLLYCFGFRAPPTEVTATFITFQRLEREGRFDPETLAAFSRLVPHLRRAVQITQRLINLNLQAEAVRDALDRLSFGVLFLDKGRRVLTANCAAEEIFLAGDGLLIVDGQLHATSHVVDCILQRLVTGYPATIVAVGTNPGGATAVPRPSGKPPYLAFIAPFVGRDLPFATERPATVVFLTDPERKHRLQADHLRESHGLTATEACLAALIASGYSIEAAASELGCARSTARLHLEHIYAKTGVHRQVDLVRLLLTLPVILQRGDGTGG